MPALLNSDKDLLTALGLSENQAADAIGRSRQSLYQADLETRQNYFKKSDIVSLVLEARTRDRTIDLAPVEDYLASTRDGDQLPDLHALMTPEIDDKTLRKYNDLWIIIPDFSRLMRKYPKLVERLMRLCLCGPDEGCGTVTVYTPSETEKQLVEGELEQLRAKTNYYVRAHVAAEDWIAAIPFLILGNPLREADSFIMSEGRYLPQEWVGAAKLVLLIKKLVADKAGAKAI